MKNLGSWGVSFVPSFTLLCCSFERLNAIEPNFGGQIFSYSFSPVQLDAILGSKKLNQNERDFWLIFQILFSFLDFFKKTKFSKK